MLFNVFFSLTLILKYQKITWFQVTPQTGSKYLWVTGLKMVKLFSLPEDGKMSTIDKSYLFSDITGTWKPLKCFGGFHLQKRYSFLYGI